MNEKNFEITLEQFTQIRDIFYFEYFFDGDRRIFAYKKGIPLPEEHKNCIVIDVYSDMGINLVIKEPNE